MEILLTLLGTKSSLPFPLDFGGWLGLLLLLGLDVFLVWRWRGYHRPGWSGSTGSTLPHLPGSTLPHLPGSTLPRNRWQFLLILAISTLAASLFLGFRLPPGRALPPPGEVIDPNGAAVMIFSGLPWVLAGGLLGVIPAAILGFISGLVQAMWSTHSLFTPLEMTLLAILFSAAVNQRYRTLTFRLVSSPLVTSILLSLLYPLLALLDMLLTAQGALVSRMDYAISTLGGVSLAIAIELLIAGLAGEAIRWTNPSTWGSLDPLVPSPVEKSLQARLLYSVIPSAFILVLILMVGDWLIASSAAREMLQARLQNTAQVAANSVPYFFKTGESLIKGLREDPQLTTTPPEELPTLLQGKIKVVPFFRQLIILDTQGKIIAGYPENPYPDPQTKEEESWAIQLALKNLSPIQTITIPPAPDGISAQVSFITPLVYQQQVWGVLIAHSDLDSNPVMQPAIDVLKQLDEIQGQGFIINEDQRIIYHPESARLMDTYTGRPSETPVFREDAAPDGTRRLVFYQPAVGSDWAVVIQAPAHYIQQLALNIAAPLVGIIIALTIFAILLARLGLRLITASLSNLAVEAAHISQGQLDNPLPVEGEDEVGKLRRAFEQMRASLKARLDELNRLLLVSQGIASSLDLEQAVQPVFESALATGSSAVRVVLAPNVIIELDEDTPNPASYGMGPARELYRYLDEQILGLARQQNRLVLPNLTRPRLLNLAKDVPRPESLIAFALYHEDTFYGALWLAYDQPHNFPVEEVRFLATLAGQVALAAAKAHLFQTAEIGRQRLAGILASTPDPVLVTDSNGRLLLANPAAWQVLGLGIEASAGQPIQKVVSQKPLVELMRSTVTGHQPTEITLPGGRTYLAMASTVLAEGKHVGKVCVLRDVTHFKELDILKSEFVHTVSHDLRSPLTLMRGYTTMLEMVGELNEQQTNYVRKIVEGIESMTRLVNNLLDLSRIESGVGLQLESVSVRDITERVVNALQLQAMQRRVGLNMDILENTPPIIEADQALLQQALHNLVENAIKYTKAEGRVNVRILANQGQMIFEVKDTGIGISPMDQTRLFEKFFRVAPPGSKDQNGTGLGLAIVKSIVERHGGRVWVESQLGKGSTFTMTIPLKQPKTRN